jgi:glycosyltransferase involved in cell wall biosynthesis
VSLVDVLPVHQGAFPLNATELNTIDRAHVPLVSIVIPTYNRAHVIPRTLENVFRQTYSNLEIIVVDDGSTDDTQAVLAQFSQRIRIVRQQNGGPGSARNRGIKEAKGEFLAFQDSDDEWHPSKLERQVGLLRKLGPSVPCCVCNAIFRSEDGSAPERETFDIAMLHTTHEQGLWLNPAEILATRPLFFNQVVTVRRDALDKIGGFNPTLRYLEDWDLALKLSMLGPWGFIRESLAYWNPGTDGSYTARAEREAVRLHQYASQLLSAAIPVASQNSNSKISKHLNQTLGQHRRTLFGWQIRERHFPGASFLSRVILLAERCRAAILRRSSHFPHMITQPIV